MHKIIDIEGAIDHYGYQSSVVRYYLNQYQGEKVICRVNSLGGSVDQAIAISKLFQDHGDVTVEFVGFCASCVTFMAFGAKEIIASDDTFWLCHKSSSTIDICKSMNVDDIDALIKQLESNKESQKNIDLVIAQKYLSRCETKGKTLKDVFDLMDEDKWITAQEALDWGFIDRINKSTAKISNDARKLMIENCAAMKLPALPVAKTEESGTSEDKLVTKIVNGLKKVMNRDNTNTNTQTKTENQENSKPQTNTLTMNKTFMPVNQILNVEGLAENAGKFELSAEQMQNISNALEAANKQKTDFDAAVATLNAISNKIESIEGVNNKINALALFIDKVPSGAPATGSQLENEGKKDFADCTDPINAYLG